MKVKVPFLAAKWHFNVSSLKVSLHRSSGVERQITFYHQPVVAHTVCITCHMQILHTVHLMFAVSPECAASVAHSRMYISAFSLLSGARSVGCKAQTRYRDVLALKRQ